MAGVAGTRAARARELAESRDFELAWNDGSMVKFAGGALELPVRGYLLGAGRQVEGADGILRAERARGPKLFSLMDARKGAMVGDHKLNQRVRNQARELINAEGVTPGVRIAKEDEVVSARKEEAARVLMDEATIVSHVLAWLFARNLLEHPIVAWVVKAVCPAQAAHSPAPSVEDEDEDEDETEGTPPRDDAAEDPLVAIVRAKRVKSWNACHPRTQTKRCRATFKLVAANMGFADDEWGEWDAMHALVASEPTLGASCVWECQEARRGVQQRAAGLSFESCRAFSALLATATTSEQYLQLRSMSSGIEQLTGIAPVCIGLANARLDLTCRLLPEPPSIQDDRITIAPDNSSVGVSLCIHDVIRWILGFPGFADRVVTTTNTIGLSVFIDKAAMTKKEAFTTMSFSMIGLEGVPIDSAAYCFPVAMNNGKDDAAATTAHMQQTTLSDLMRLERYGMDFGEVHMSFQIFPVADMLAFNEIAGYSGPASNWPIAEVRVRKEQMGMINERWVQDRTLEDGYLANADPGADKRHGCKGLNLFNVPLSRYAAGCLHLNLCVHRHMVVALHTLFHGNATGGVKTLFTRFREQGVAIKVNQLGDTHVCSVNGSETNKMLQPGFWRRIISGAFKDDAALEEACITIYDALSVVWLRIMHPDTCADDSLSIAVQLLTVGNLFIAAFGKTMIKPSLFRLFVTYPEDIARLASMERELGLEHNSLPPRVRSEAAFEQLHALIVKNLRRGQGQIVGQSKRNREEDVEDRTPFRARLNEADESGKPLDTVARQLSSVLVKTYQSIALRFSKVGRVAEDVNRHRKSAAKGRAGYGQGALVVTAANSNVGLTSGAHPEASADTSASIGGDVSGTDADEDGPVSGGGHLNLPPTDGDLLAGDFLEDGSDGEDDAEEDRRGDWDGLADTAREGGDGVMPPAEPRWIESERIDRSTATGFAQPSLNAGVTTSNKVNLGGGAGNNLEVKDGLVRLRVNAKLSKVEFEGEFKLREDEEEVGVRVTWTLSSIEKIYHEEGDEPRLVVSTLKRPRYTIQQAKMSKSGHPMKKPNGQVAKVWSTISVDPNKHCPSIVSKRSHWEFRGVNSNCFDNLIAHLKSTVKPDLLVVGTIGRLRLASDMYGSSVQTDEPVLVKGLQVGVYPISSHPVATFEAVKRLIKSNADAQDELKQRSLNKTNLFDPKADQFMETYRGLMKGHQQTLDEQVANQVSVIVGSDPSEDESEPAGPTTRAAAAAAAAAAQPPAPAVEDPAGA